MAQLVLTSGQNTNDFVLDALPYIDDAQYDESHRRFALKLIEDEQKRFPLTKDYLKNFSKPNYSKFLTPSLEGEFKRMSEGKVNLNLTVIFILVLLANARVRR